MTASPGASPAPTSSWQGAVRQVLSMTISLAFTCGLLALLIWSPFDKQDPSSDEYRKAPEEVAKLLGTDRISVKPDSLLAKKLVIVDVQVENLSTPMLRVSGSVVARLGPNVKNVETGWDFSMPDMATSYADWLKARAEVPFAEKQLTTVRELVKARVSAQTKVVERLENLVKVGTDTQKDLDASKAELMQAKLQGGKDEREADNSLKIAQRSRAMLERQLYLVGVDPELLVEIVERTSEQSKVSTAVVVAEVPEAMVGLVRRGQSCQAKFFAFPGEIFPAKVASLGPSVARERRTLRVFFELDDVQSRLRPGMFAEVGLATDPRASVLVPSDAILHVGRSDYVLKKVDNDLWRITEVRVGEALGTRVEILSGLKVGDQVIGSGAILLQPLLVKAQK